ncbi:MAG: hypothetical protein ABI415_00965 [Flavitalea sp.]
MKHQPGDKKFIFDENIDKEFIYSLYEDDYTYITEVFYSCLESVNEGIPVLHHAFELGDVLMVKQAAHKLKPVFGFTGLLNQQDTIGIFENVCVNISAIDVVKNEFEELMNQIIRGRNILEKEGKRLQQFTGNHS